MSNKEIGMNCVGRQCGFGAFAGELGCTDGGNCFEAGLLKANVSNFHDQTLVDASDKINSIISSIPADPAGRQLSFIQTGMGTMLAWVRHDIDVPQDAVHGSASDDEVAEALGIIQ
jgi:hypothetical protein